MTGIVASTVFTCLSISIAFTVLSIARPDLRTWPRPQSTPWPRPLLALVGGLFQVGLLGLLLLGGLDWNSTTLSSWVRFVGGAMFVCGCSFASWAYRTLGVYRSSGREGDLIDTGAYRYSRNPQYIGTIIGAVGYALLCNSFLTLIAAGLAVVNFVLVPFAEEPWLRELLGAPYDDYCARVPRFLPPRVGTNRRTSADR